MQRDDASIPSFSEETRQDCGDQDAEVSSEAEHSGSPGQDVDDLQKEARVPSLASYSLPELLLYPSRRFEEYLNLLYALRLHTPAEHVDRGALTTAIDHIKKYKDYIDKVGC